jgi:hypothetical protein
MSFHSPYRDYLEKKLEGFRLIHNEIVKKDPGSNKELELQLTIKMLENELHTMNIMREDNDE